MVNFWRRWDILNGHLYHFDSSPVATAPNGQVMQTLPLQQLTRPLHYRGVTFNFDTKGSDETKEKAIRWPIEDGSRNGTGYL